MTTTTKHREPVQQLQALGFSEYEARAYVALLEGGELSGYAWARQAGLPRPNIYAVAERLAERGAVRRGENHKGKTWSAVPADTLLASIRAHYARSLEQTERSLAELNQASPATTVFSLRGDELLGQAGQLIDTGRNNLLIALQPQEAADLAGPLRAARKRGVAITTLCMEACPQPCGNCQGDVHCHALAPTGAARWLVLTIDHHQALLGQKSGHQAEGVLTSQPLVVELAEAYVRQSIALATLGTELAGRFEGLISQQAKDLLASLFPEGMPRDSRGREPTSPWWRQVLSSKKR